MRRHAADNPEHPNLDSIWRMARDVYLQGLNALAMSFEPRIGRISLATGDAWFPAAKAPGWSWMAPSQSAIENS